MKSIALGKAPGPDGFTCLFYQQCWEFIKTDIMVAFHCLGHLAVNIIDLQNQAMLTLVPTKLDAQEPCDFRPISLLHSFAKLLSKVLARRLAPELSKLVSPNQSAFSKARFIQDNSLLVRQSACLLH